MFPPYSLTTLVEDTFLKNFNSKVVLVSHSLGGIFTTWFLNHQPHSWKVNTEVEL